ncbi:ATP-binding protein [Neobacillus cucumis]|uniref:histidine kinase n=1 Tax=Neobacillus cucumis TaxID=1740721 RepID=A0A2N5HC67_9BACI|nr:ATP-binding protein [Neobacillus cucumis]PLS03115.1 two-component sensor histidine kinase [Neobacillus cucumis]
MVLIRLLKAVLHKKLIIYLLIALIPSVAVSMTRAHHKVRVVDSEYQLKAQKYANFHAINIEKFVGETVGRLEMLSTSINVQHNNLNDIGKILRETRGKDPRFSGFYWATTKGDIVIDTNQITSPVNVSDRPYFQQALHTGQTSISEAHYGRVTGRYIISIATPIVENSKVKGVFVASLRMDEIKKEITRVVNGERILIKDETGKPLIQTGPITKNYDVKSVINVSRVPWSITAFVDPNTKKVFWNSFFTNLIIFLTILSILFLLLQYLILKRKLQKEKEQTERHKLELIGNLAASTAHEIRNPLTGIKGLVKLLSEENKDEKAQTYFKVIQSEIDRINSIVSELLILGKPTANIFKICDANEIVSEIAPIISSEANYTDVDVSFNFHPEKLPVSCVKDQLKQVILNLTKNALQAMPYGGKLAVRLDKQSDSCRITVTDNGIGMSKDQISQAFNPFYTLKKDGSGLGLTVCKRIIDSYGGKINIASTPNQGTQVEIVLPLASQS